MAHCTLCAVFMSEETAAAVQTPPQEIELSNDEREAVMPNLARISQLQGEINKIVDTIQPFLALIAKIHGVTPTEYALSSDGSRLIRTVKEA